MPDPTIKDLEFITDNSIDKIFMEGTTQHTCPGRVGIADGLGASLISHGKTLAPLFEGQFSLDNTNWSPIEAVDNFTFGPFDNIYATMYSDGSNIYFLSQNVSTTARTVYFQYKIYFKEIS